MNKWASLLILGAATPCLFCEKEKAPVSNEKKQESFFDKYKPTPDGSVDYPKVYQPPIYIGKKLYTDSSSTLYLKTKNRTPRHPIYNYKTWPDSIYHSKVSVRGTGRDSALSNMIDTATFSQMDRAGVYFSDSEWIYVYAIWPYPDQFFALKRAGARFLDSEKEFLLAGGVLYSHGKIVDSIQAEKARLVRFNRTDTVGFHEFITDGKFLIYDYYPLDEERLSLFEGLSERDKERIKKRYFRTDSSRRSTKSNRNHP